jgi:hypothetical protein
MMFLICNFIFVHAIFAKEQNFINRLLEDTRGDLLATPVDLPDPAYVCGYDFHFLHGAKINETVEQSSRSN